MINDICKFEHHTQDNIQIFKIIGKLQYGSTQSIKEDLLNQVDYQLEHYVFDLTGITYIDSTGMGIFVTFLKHVNDSNKKIVLVIEDLFINELFKIAKLDTIFSLTESVEQAVKNLTAGTTV
ncbi:STAS domain-containing protein [Bacillus sp. AK128]